MPKLTLKNTKQEILDALHDAEKKLKEANAVMSVPGASVERQHEADVVEQAEADVADGVFSDAMNDKFTNLQTAIALQEKRLAECFGVEKTLIDMTVALNAQKQAQLDVAAETESARAEAKKAVEQLRAENAQIAADLKRSREREQAEYDYNLKRNRQIEADKFADETAALEKKCAEKRAELASLTEDADRILAMQARIECLDEELDAKYQAGYADGEKAAGKEYGIKTSMAAKEHDFELRDRDGQITRLTADVAAKDEKIKSLEEKLDKAYAQLRDMAVKTVESSGGVKIIGASDTGSGRK